MKILMVCMGNICRSPLAEGIMKKKVQERGLDWQVDSCGTDGYHNGAPPCAGSQEVARRHGIDISGYISTRLRKADFKNYDLLLLMDKTNYRDALKVADSESDVAKMKMILDYPFPGEEREVPDPFWTNSGFDNVFELLEDACEAALEQIIAGKG